MSGYQKIVLVGNLGKDPKVEATQSGTTVATFTVATSERFKGRDGVVKEETQWHNIRAFGRLGEICGNYLRKGSLVLIEGRVKYSKSAGRDGIERFYTTIFADEMKMLGPKAETAPKSQPAVPRTTEPVPPTGSFDDTPFDDDIPF